MALNTDKVSETTPDTLDPELQKLFEAMFDPVERMRIARVEGGEYLDVEAPFDPGNIWRPEGTPFTAVPTWMRSFMFRVLKPREIAVLLHICSYMQTGTLSYVSLRELQRDFGLKNRHELIDAIGQLERLGFILRKKGRVAKSRTEHDRNVFQRPSLAYTLLRLLEEDAIDGSFHPTSKAVSRIRRGAVHGTTRLVDKSLLRALDKILGLAFVKAYLKVPVDQRALLLRKALEARVAADRQGAVETPAASAASTTAKP